MERDREKRRSRWKIAVVVMIAAGVTLSFMLLANFATTASEHFSKSYHLPAPQPKRTARPGAKTSATTCPSTHFDGVLLVVVFNFRFYENIPTLKKLYSKVFADLYFCGPSDDSKGKVNDEVHEFELRRGYYGYVCMAHAILDNPHYKGYLYTNDDIIINWWNLMRFDLTRVWQGPRRLDFTQDAYSQQHNAWMWWDTEMGLKACQLVYEEIQQIAPPSHNSNDRTSFEQVVSNYLANGKGRPRCGKGWSDFFYVPVSKAAVASRLLMLCYQHHLFLEMTVSNVIRMLDVMENVEILDGLFLPDVGVTDSSDAVGFWTNYNANLTFVHPFKMNAGSKKLNKAVLNLVYRIGEEEFKSRCTSTEIKTLD